MKLECTKNFSCKLQTKSADRKKMEKKPKKKKKGQAYSSQHLSRLEPATPTTFESGQDHFQLLDKLKKKGQDYYVIHTIGKFLFPKTMQLGTELEREHEISQGILGVIETDDCMMRVHLYQWFSSN